MSVLLKWDGDMVRHSYYEASAIRPPARPPLAGQASADVCVVGGGHAGLSAALELAQRGMKVVLLEAQRLGSGASGRNGGQIIAGFAGQEALESQLSPSQARQAWAMSMEGIELMRDRMRRHAIDCDHVNGYLQVAVNARKALRLHRWAEDTFSRYGHPMVWIPPQEMGNWVASPRYHAAVLDRLSGHIHPLKYCLGLAEAAAQAGVQLFEHSPVHHIDRGARPRVHTLAEGQVDCDAVVLAGNVYLGEYGDAVAPELSGRIMPIATYVIATEPMDASRAASLIGERAAVSDTNFVLDYFRLSSDNRMLFGTGESHSVKAPRRLIEGVRGQMLKVFPQLSDLAVAHAWGGYVDLTLNRAPDFGRVDHNIYYLQGFSGHGLALSGLAGKLAAEAIAGQAARFDVFAKVRHLPFPGGVWLRTPALMLGMWFFRLRDLL
jgi:gamma-glutamylputrescine oxidase